jgi:hypothetical protein
MTKNQWARFSLILMVLLSGMDLGGTFYEHALVFPVWSANPPSTFALIQPQNGGISLIRFWIPVHSLFTLGLILALVLNWSKKNTRKLILLAFTSYAVMRIWTFAYFVPEIGAFIEMPLTTPSSLELTARAMRWGMLSHGRTVLVLISTVCLFLAVMKDDKAPLANS